MAVPVLASSSSFHDTGNSTSRTCSVPSGTVSGNWLLLAVGIDSAATVTTPTGWTLVKSQTDTTAFGTLYLFKRKADGTEGANITIASTSEYCTGVCIRVTGADSTDCIDVISAANGEIGVRGNVRFGQCWAAYTDSLLFAVSFIDSGATTFSSGPSGFTSVIQEAGGSSGNAMGTWQKDQAAQGYTGFVTATTAATGEQHASFLVVIRSTSGAISYPSSPVMRAIDYYYPPQAGAVSPENPYGTTTDDLLVMVGATDVNAISLDAEFTSIQNTNNGAVIYHNAGRRVVTGAETPPYTLITTTAGAKIAACIRIANVDTANPINNSSVATGTSASPAGSTITTTANNCLLLATYAADDDDGADDTNYPSGYTGVFNSITEQGNDASFGLAYLVQTSAGATGAVTWTNGLTASEEWVALNIAIAPAASSSGAASATGTCTVTATSTATKDAVAATAGTCTVTATSIATKASVAASNGTSTVAATGVAAITGVASSSGTSTVAATSTATKNSVASAQGVAVATAISAAIKDSIASSSGTSVATVISAATKDAVAGSAGTSAVAAIGISTAAGVAQAVGTSTAEAVGESAVDGSAVASAEGTSTAGAISESTANSVAEAEGVSTAAAIGISIFVGIAEASGTSTAGAVGAYEITPSSTDPGWLGGGGYTYHSPHVDYQNRIRQEQEDLRAINKELALAEQKRAEAERLLAQKTARQRQMKAARLLAAQEASLLEEINVLRMERVRLMRLIDDEEAMLVILMSRPIF